MNNITQPDRPVLPKMVIKIYDWMVNSVVISKTFAMQGTIFVWDRTV